MSMKDTPSMHEVAENVTDAARAKAVEAGTEALHHAQDEVKTAADAAHAAGDAFDPGTMQREAAHHLAEGLEQVAARMRDADIGDLAGRATQFAKENPALTLAGAALLGFAAARFLKSSSGAARHATPTTASGDGNDPWTGHVSSTSLDDLEEKGVRYGHV